MVEQLTFQTFIMFIQAIGILVAVIYHITTLRNQSRTRQAQLFMQIYDKFNDYERTEITTEALSYEWEDAEDFWSKYSFETNPESYRKWNYVAGFLEGVGVLVKRKLIDPEVVDDLMSVLTLRFWEKYGPVIVDGRKRLNQPQLWEWAEYLYKEIQRITEQQHPELKT